ncbi:MAG TPA: hypothetical protein VF017_19240 [Thermoanaerobaculia bacterium]|nr:hypothetical protein [Thermoanaerobaculia bacterium]
MLSNRFSIVFMLALVLLAGTPAWAGITTSFDNTAGTGSLFSGWYWLRDGGDRATWTVTESSTSVPGDMKCELWIDALVTNTSSGGSGHDKTMDLEITVSGYSTQKLHFVFDNSAAVTTTDSKGAGYEIKRRMLSRRGLVDPLNNITLSSADQDKFANICQWFKVRRSMTIRYAWTPTREACCANNAAMTHHVAVNDKTMNFSFYR